MSETSEISKLLDKYWGLANSQIYLSDEMKNHSQAIDIRRKGNLVFIYGLVSSGITWYVGSTFVPYRRYVEHLCEKTQNTKKQIALLKEAQNYPKMIVLDACLPSHRLFIEAYWINTIPSNINTEKYPELYQLVRDIEKIDSFPSLRNNKLKILDRKDDERFYETIYNTNFDNISTISTGVKHASVICRDIPRPEYSVEQNIENSNLQPKEMQISIRGITLTIISHNVDMAVAFTIRDLMKCSDQKLGRMNGAKLYK